MKHHKGPTYRCEGSESSPGLQRTDLLLQVYALRDRTRTEGPVEDRTSSKSDAGAESGEPEGFIQPT